MQTTINEAIQTHYHQTHQDLSEVILAALEKSGKDLSCLTLEDLAPFDDQTFDVVWTEHAAMNISDKAQLYKEMYRVLKSGGTLAIYDVLAGSSESVIFPVPWARTADTSFLIQPAELHQLLVNTGFTVTDWTDTTEAAREWFVRLAEKIKNQGLPPLGFHILLGNDFQLMAQNQRRNLEEGRIVLAQVIAKK